MTRYSLDNLHSYTQVKDIKEKMVAIKILASKKFTTAEISNPLPHQILHEIEVKSPVEDARQQAQKMLSDFEDWVLASEDNGMTVDWDDYLDVSCAWDMWRSLND